MEDKFKIDDLVWASALDLSRNIPENKWEMSVSSGNESYSLITIKSPYAPNWFHRFMQKLVLGINWKKIK